ncbi:YsnF/AvaK domain-containing protein, partial [bacterium]
YWRNNYTDRPYVKKGESYDDYADAYRYGGTAARTHAIGSSSAASSGGGTGVVDRVKEAGAKVKDALTPNDAMSADARASSSTYAPAARFEDRESTIRADYEKSPSATKLPYDRARHAIKDAYDRSIQLREERLNVGKERVQAGEATIRKEVTTEHRTVDVPLQREELVIERRPASGAAAGGAIGEAETIRVPLSEERATINKDTVVTEEVSIGKKATTHTEHVGADVRKETLKVDENVRDQTKR